MDRVLDEMLPVILLVLGIVALVVLIVNITGGTRTKIKRENGKSSIHVLLSIAGEIFSKSTPSLVLFTGFFVVEGVGNSPPPPVVSEPQCIAVAEIEQQLPSLIDKVIPDLSKTPTMIRDVLVQGANEERRIAELLLVLDGIFVELQEFSPYTYNATLRRLVAELE